MSPWNLLTLPWRQCENYPSHSWELRCSFGRKSVRQTVNAVAAQPTWTNPGTLPSGARCDCCWRIFTSTARAYSSAINLTRGRRRRTTSLLRRNSSTTVTTTAATENSQTPRQLFSGRIPVGERHTANSSFIQCNYLRSFTRHFGNIILLTPHNSIPKSEDPLTRKYRSGAYVPLLARDPKRGPGVLVWEIWPD